MFIQLSSIGELKRVPWQQGALVVLLLAFLISGCVHNNLPNAPKNYVNQDLYGVIDGKLWTYKHAYVDPSIATPEEEDLVVVFLPFKPKNPCDKAAHEQAGVTSVMATAPNSTLAVMLERGTSRMLQFHFERQGRQFVTSAKVGKLKLTKLGTDKLQGKLLAKYNNKLWVAGNFEAVICDYRDMHTRKEDD